MDWSEVHREGLNIALAEAACLGMDVDEPRARVSIRLAVLTMPESGTPPDDRTVTLVLDDVGRIAASLRAQQWHDVEPTVYPLELGGLDSVVQSFAGAALHGWEFVDLPESSWAQWRHLLSLDTALPGVTDQHLLELSLQEGLEPRELDVRVWFGDLHVYTPDEQQIPLDQFIAGGRRWWDAHDHNDPRTLVDDVAPPL